MSGHLAGYAAEIERYLRGGSGVTGEDLDDNKSLAGARHEASEFQAMKSDELTGGDVRLGQGQTGFLRGGGRNVPRSLPGGAGSAGSSMSSRASIKFFFFFFFFYFTSWFMAPRSPVSGRKRRRKIGSDPAAAAVVAVARTVQAERRGRSIRRGPWRIRPGSSGGRGEVFCLQGHAQSAIDQGRRRSAAQLHRQARGRKRR